MTHDPFLDLSLDRQLEHEQEWQAARNVFQAFHGLESSKRFHHLGLLFEKLVPWIERSIRAVILRHFLVLPQETLVARLFARAARLDELPNSHEAFQIWVEASILQDLTEPAEQSGLIGGACGEPSPELQRRFNALSLAERALLYLYLAEGLSLARLAAHTGVPVRTAVNTLKRAWGQVSDDSGKVQLPQGWKAPEDTVLGND